MEASELKKFWQECKEAVLAKFDRNDAIDAVVAEAKALGPTIEPWVASAFGNCQTRGAETAGDAIDKIDAQFAPPSWVGTRSINAIEAREQIKEEYEESFGAHEARPLREMPAAYDRIS